MAEELKFKVGDLVKLKSGGPTMTIEDVFPDTIKCQWFSGGKMLDGRFPKASVEFAPKEKAKKSKA